MFVDSHAHLDFKDLKQNLSKIINNAIENKISSILSICTKIDQFENLLNLINNYNSIWSSIGEHPCNISKNNIPKTETIISRAKNYKVIAIGETGLDFYYTKDNIDYQYESFKNHLDASIKTNLPLIIHLRNSEKETMEFLTKENKKNKLKVIMHCFTGNKKTLFECLNNNFYISLSGIVTFKNAYHLQDLLKNIPLDKLLLETDSPYLSPMPLRGKINEPSNIRHIAKFLSSKLNISEENIGKYTTENFYKIFSKAKKYNHIDHEN